MPSRPDQLGAHAGLVVLDVARVGDLTATLRVERRLLELRVEGAVPAILVGEDCGEHVGALVADELAARCLEERGGDVERAARARDLAMLRHCAPVAVDVDGLAALLRELHGQLEREPVRGGEGERRLAGDRVASRERVELPQAPLERVAEPLFLGPQHALDLVGVLDDLGVPGADLLDDDARDAVDVFEADPARLHDRTADQAAASRSRGPRSTA